MGSITRLTAVAAIAFVVQLNGAGATTSTAGSTSPKATEQSCPKGTVAQPPKTGECNKVKKHRMGFDLAAPSDDNTSSTSTASNTRSVTNKPNQHH